MSQAPKVALRDARAEDRDRLRTWRNLPAIRQWMYTDHEIGPDEHARWFEAALIDPRRRYWVIEADGAPVGLANLYDIDTANRRASWAYYLAEDAVRGKGVGAYVEYLVIEQVFGSLGLTKLWCEVLIGNAAVWKMHESFGFQREALFRQHIWRGEEALDVIGLGLTAADWRAVRPTSLARLQARGFAFGARPGG